MGVSPLDQKYSQCCLSCTRDLVCKYLYLFREVIDTLELVQCIGETRGLRSTYFVLLPNDNLLVDCVSNCVIYKAEKKRSETKDERTYTCVHVRYLKEGRRIYYDVFKEVPV